MDTLTFNRSKRVVLTVAPRKYAFLVELLQNFDFVQVDQESYNDDSRNYIIDNLKQAANDIKLIREGQLEGRPVEELLNEL